MSCSRLSVRTLTWPSTMLLTSAVASWPTTSTFPSLYSTRRAWRTCSRATLPTCPPSSPPTPTQWHWHSASSTHLAMSPRSWSRTQPSSTTSNWNCLTTSTQLATSRTATRLPPSGSSSVTTASTTSAPCNRQTSSLVGSFSQNRRWFRHTSPTSWMRPETKALLCSALVQSSSTTGRCGGKSLLRHWQGYRTVSSGDTMKHSPITLATTLCWCHGYHNLTYLRIPRCRCLWVTVVWMPPTKHPTSASQLSQSHSSLTNRIKQRSWHCMPKWVWNFRYIPWPPTASTMPSWPSTQTLAIDSTRSESPSSWTISHSDNMTRSNTGSTMWFTYRGRHISSQKSTTWPCASITCLMSCLFFS